MNDKALLDPADTLAWRLVSFLNETGAVYAALGIPEIFPEKGGKDWDICSGDYRAFIQGLARFCEAEDVLLFNIQYHAFGVRCDLVSFLEDGSIVIPPAPDIALFPTWQIKGDIGLSFEALLEARVLHDSGFYVPSNHDSFIYYLIKRVDKGRLTDKHTAHLSRVWRNGPEPIRKSVLEFWPGEPGQTVVEAAETGNWAAAVALIPQLQTGLKRKSRWSPSRTAWIVRRAVRRIFCPAGIKVVFLGPDGSGKSSVIQRVTASFAPVFRGASYFHLRPDILRRRRGPQIPVNNPHGEAPRGRILSVAKIFYYILDYNLGYFLRELPVILRNGMVVFDRYYYDMQVDPRRFRYSGPAWLTRLAARFIPNPDLLIVLNASPEILQARKQDVTMSESARQTEVYTELAGGMKNAVIVDASQPLDKVVAEVNIVIAKYMAERTGRRLGM